MDVKKVVAICLRQYRALQGLTQDRMAERCGISTRYYHNLEYGKSNPSFAVMARLHRNCGIDLNKLADSVEDKM